MGPHDLLCKWCSTFVGKGKKFCSIFCESRYTRSKRRKLAFKRPVHSSGPHTDKDYESPRSNKTAPTRKETFLEDVITAIENEKPSPERDKRRLYFSARESDDEVGYCRFCCRQLYIPDTIFCDRACENRKRQLSWKSAHIGNDPPHDHSSRAYNRRPAITVIANNHRVAWRNVHEELPKARRNRYVWGVERKPEDFGNFMNYKPSWEMVRQ